MSEHHEVGVWEPPRQADLAGTARTSVVNHADGDALDGERDLRRCPEHRDIITVVVPEGDAHGGIGRERFEDLDGADVARVKDQVGARRRPQQRRWKRAREVGDVGCRT